MTQMINQKYPPWAESVHRVLIHSVSYLDFNSNYSPGGRQRYIKDLAHIIRDWGREVLVVQKGNKAFEKTCPDGITVVGLPSDIRAKGDLSFARRARKLTNKNDVWLYASGEDAWPFFATNSKAIQHGVWWDGPQGFHIRLVQKMRAMSMMRSIRSVLCVDTNFINWLRCQGVEGYQLCTKCQYVPNYVDLLNLPTTIRKKNERLSIIVARRFEEKRGSMLFLDALAVLRKQAIPFDAKICTVGGMEVLKARIVELGLSDSVHITEESMDSVLKCYQHFHVAVVPTLWSEGTSLACVEALAAGLPVVCTPVGGLGNLIIPGFNGFIVNPDPSSIANALQIFTDDSVWETMSTNCLSMRTIFGLGLWSKNIKRWLEK